MYKLPFFAYPNNMKKLIKTYYILIPILILNSISLLYLKETEYFTKQLLFYGLSFLILIIVSLIKKKELLKYSKYFYLISLFLLLLVLIIGREVKGAKAWLHIYNISIQPSEIAKVALLIYLTDLTNKGSSFLKKFILVLIPSILTFLEPDTGAIIFYFIILFSTLKYSKIKKKIAIPITIFIFLIGIFHIILFVSNKQVLIDIYGSKLFYRIDRIISFKNKDNMQTINSQIAIGANKLLYIPENHNDFIFASIISKYNSCIFILLLLCYLSLFLYFIKNTEKKRSIKNIYNFILLNLLLFQVFYNIFMNLSLVPIIGIPLPFLSYGGSSTITLYFLMGLAINFNSNKVLDKDHMADMALDLD